MRLSQCPPSAEVDRGREGRPGVRSEAAVGATEGSRQDGPFLKEASNASDRPGAQRSSQAIERPESTYCGRSRPRPWTPQLGGKRAYSGRLGKDRSLDESQHSSASPK